MELEDQFRELGVGDVFHSEYPGSNGGLGSAICLITATDDTTTTARAVTTHYNLVFDKSTLTAAMGRGKCVVKSARRVPDEIYKIILDIDWKYNPANPTRDPKLTREQIDTFVFLGKHYRYSENADSLSQPNGPDIEQ